MSKRKQRPSPTRAKKKAAQPLIPPPRARVARIRKKRAPKPAVRRFRLSREQALAGLAGLVALSLAVGIAVYRRQTRALLTVTAGPGDTSASLAQRYLGAESQAWLIEDRNNGARSFAPGQSVAVPLRPWNVTGVYPDGYQVVPILVYHNLAARSGGRLMLGADKFEEQMRYLKREGFRVVSLPEFVEWTRLERQLPLRAVVLTFDDGYRSFNAYAHPILKELGYTATLFVPTGFVGAGPGFKWDELKALAAEGFDIEPHSKSHGFLTRAPKESEEAYARRLEVEIAEPRRVFEGRFGKAPALFAYPYGDTDAAVVDKVREQGYVAAFTVKRQSSPSFVSPFVIPRRQVYSEMTLADFAKNLETFHAEPLARAETPEPRGRLLATLALDPSDGGAFALLREALQSSFLPASTRLAQRLLPALPRADVRTIQ